MTNQKINIESLYKSYGDKQVLNNINLSFNKGEINGIVGENGAGKTTFFKCLVGLEDFEGSIMYGDKKIKNISGWLPTNPIFLSKITGFEYLQLMCNARNLKKNINEGNVFDLPLKRYAETYSTGMKKKLALTAILLQDNEIFILDEPFNGVDIHSNILIKEVLLKLKELDKIVLLSSHIFSTLTETCNYLHHLKDGQIVRSVDRNDFDLVESDMKNVEIGNKIAQLDLK